MLSGAKGLPKSLQENKITNDMNSIDKVAENVMVQLIHTLAENGVDISSKEFIRHVGFIDECVKSTLFLSMGYDHPLGELVKYLVGATKSKDNGKIFTSFLASSRFYICNKN